MSYKTDADEIYQAKYKGRGLAPKHVVALKEVLVKALRKKEKPTIAAKHFFKEKGIKLNPVEKPATVEKPVKVEKPATPAKVAKVAKVEKPAKPVAVTVAPNVKPALMDRNSVKAMLEELKRGGVAVSWSRKDTDDELQEKLNQAMKALATPAVLETLERIDPAKLTAALNKDCIGLFIDLRTPVCVACPDMATCIKTYVENLKGNFTVFKDALADIKTEEAAALITDDVVPDTEPVVKKTASKLRSKKTTYDPTRKIFFVGEKGPEDIAHDDDTLAFLTQVFDVLPETMQEFRTIVEGLYVINSDAEFVDQFITGLRSEEVLKFENELTPAERKAYIKAGYTF